MSNNKQHSTPSYALWGFILFSVVYVLLKAILAPVSFEESRGFLEIVYQNKAYPWQAFDKDNYSFLNNLLVWFSYRIVGLNEWVIRLPNVLAFGVFLFFLLKLARKLKHYWLRIALIASFLFSLFIVDLFAMSSGTGLGLASFIAFLYYIYNYQQNKKVADFYGASIWIIVATASEIQYFFILVFALLYFSASLTALRSNHRFIAYGLALNFISFFGILAWKLNIDTRLYIYGRYTLIQSIENLSKQLFPISGKWLAVYTGILLTLGLFAPFFAGTKSRVKGGIFTVILLFNVLTILFIRSIWDIKFSFEFTALHLWVALLISIFFLLDSIPKQKLASILLAPLLFLPITYILNISVTYYANENWAKRQLGYDVYQLVSQEKASTASWPFNFSYPFVFQNLKDKESQAYLQPGNVLNSPDIKVAPADQNIDSANYTEIERLKYWSIQKREPQPFTESYSRKLDYLFVTDKQYIVLCESAKDSIYSAFKVHIEFEGLFKEQPTNATITLDIRDQENVSILWKTVRLSDLNTSSNSFKKYNVTLGLDNVPEKGKKLVVYIYNVDEEKMDLRNIVTTIETR